jgi:NADPH:quinone reductase-like Zn-dependent oxidoreductase
VLVTGAVGSVGRAAVSNAKSRGVKVWAGVRRAQKEEAAKLGVDGAVALDDDAEVDRIPPLDGIADTVGGETIWKLLARVKPGGAIGSVLGAPAGAKERGLVVRGMYVHPAPRGDCAAGGGREDRHPDREAISPCRSAGGPKVRREWRDRKGDPDRVTARSKCRAAPNVLNLS